VSCGAVRALDFANSSYREPGSPRTHRDAEAEERVKNIELSSAVSHISRKTSEMWGTRNFLPIQKKQWWASPVFFGPCTLWRTWGTRPGNYASWKPTVPGTTCPGEQGLGCARCSILNKRSRLWTGFDVSYLANSRTVKRHRVLPYGMRNACSVGGVTCPLPRSRACWLICDTHGDTY
jgi:hypothetical protein